MVEDEIHRMASSEDVEERIKAAEQLQKNFADLPDKKQAWEDLHRLTSDKNGKVRRGAAIALGSAFSHVPDKKQAWDDLHRLIFDNDSGVRSGALFVLRIAFSHVPDKEKAWEDLNQLNFDWTEGDDEVELISSVFPHISDKRQKLAFFRLIELASDEGAFDDPDEEGKIRQRTVYTALHAIRSVYYRTLDEEWKWVGLIGLMKCKISYLMSLAVDTIILVFPSIPNKEKAWDDLHRLTSDTDSRVRRNTAYALGSAFVHVPDKKQAWDDLHWLTSDTDSDVRIAANHSSGRVSVFRASEAEKEDCFRKEMENALGFFEKAAKEATYYDNPSKFCLPFYRYFYTLTFKKEEADVQSYLSEAKSAVEGSESKENLLEAIENLGNALKEAQKVLDFNGMKSDLKAYKRYCDRACELLETTEEKAPGATKLIRKGLPIIDERIKGIIAEIQEKAKALCKETRGTAFEELGKNVYHIGQNLLVSNPAILEKRLNNLQISLSAICARTSDINVEEACDLLKRANNEPILENRIQLMDDAISKILPHIRNLTNIQISNSNNVQITTANGTAQKMFIEISDEKTKK